jgi:hypothetical protein
MHSNITCNIYYNSIYTLSLDQLDEYHVNVYYTLWVWSGGKVQARLTTP